VQPTADRHLLIPGPCGDLEALLSLPVATPTRLMLCCHPHPLHGGSMTNKVVHTLHRAASALGFATLRFNFRGVGRSHGSFADGIGECDDLRAVITWCRTQLKLKLVLSGFSFGSFVSAQVADEASPLALISVAPPVERINFNNFKRPQCPWTVIVPTADEIVDPCVTEAWFAEQETLDVTLLKVAGASHFFHGRLIELRQIVSNTLDNIPPQ